MPRTALAIAALVLSAAASGPAAAGAALEARYTVTFTGITLGQGVMVVEVSDEGYSAAGSAMVAGLLQIVTGGKGSAAARGQFVDGRVLPVSYSGNSESKERSQEVRLSGAAGRGIALVAHFDDQDALSQRNSGEGYRVARLKRAAGAGRSRCDRAQDEGG
jgi:hypothetical protein